jgi:hypothetical protein
MKFTFIQQTRNASGSVEQLTTDYAQNELIVGRGGASHVVLANRRLSLVHAKFSLEGEGAKLFISDLNSLAGVKVNGRRVTRSPLVSGDIVLLGDIAISVDVLADEVKLTCAEQKLPPEDADLIHQQVEKLQIGRYLPPISWLSWGAALVLVVAYFFTPLFFNSLSTWSSGPISSHHKIIEKDCQSCHTQPFQPVQDRECLYCHNMSEHAQGMPEFTKAHADLSVRCAQCHMEHNGDAGLTRKDDRQCVSCHASMTDLKSNTTVQNVVSFDSHPQFRISVESAHQSAREKVSLDDKEHLRDSSTLKLNHALHLKPGLRGRSGSTTLQCASCHQLEDNYKAMKPVTFDNHCRDCHALEFEEQLPGVEVPHGDSEQVYPALFTEYTKLFLIGTKAMQDPKPARLMPGGSGLSAKKTPPINVQLVQQKAREAETELFTKTGCYLCHNYNEKPGEEQTATNSHFVVTKPNVPAVWFPAARFGHGAHEELSCESCHEKTRTSSKTEDVLMPGVALCQECHVQSPKAGYVTSSCIECHSFHDSLSMPESSKHDAQTYLQFVER